MVVYRGRAGQGKGGKCRTGQCRAGQRACCRTDLHSFSQRFMSTSFVVI